MALQFHCEKCDDQISVKFLKIGEEAKCPHCGHINVVPDNATGETESIITKKKTISDTFENINSTHQPGFDLKDSRPLTDIQETVKPDRNQGGFMRGFGIFLLVIGLLSMIFNVFAGGILAIVGLLMMLVGKKPETTTSKKEESGSQDKQDFDFGRIEKDTFYKHLEDSFRIINDTKFIDTLLSRYDFAISRINDDHQTFMVENKDELFDQFNSAVKDALMRIFTVEIDEQIEEALKLKTSKGQKLRLEKILRETKQSFDTVPEKWKTPDLDGLYNKGIQKIEAALAKIQKV